MNVGATVAYARATDPDTSHAAAASVSDIRQSQYLVLKVLRGRPTRGYTDEELVNDYVDRMTRRHAPFALQSPSGIRTRRAELVRLGLVKDSGEKREISTGRLAKVWVIA